MLCPNCGNNLPDGAKFCGKCGNKIEAPAQAAPAPAQAAPAPAQAAPAPAQAAPAPAQAAPAPAQAAPAPAQAAPASEKIGGAFAGVLDKVKSGNKIVLIAVVAVVAIVLIGILVRNCMWAGVSKTFMGKAGYAASLVDDAVEPLKDSVVSAAQYSGVLMNMQDANDIFDEMDVEVDNEYQMAGAMVDMIGTMLSKQGIDQMTVNQSFNIELLKDFEDYAEENYINDEAIEILENINKYSLSASYLKTNSDYSASFDVKYDKDTIVAVAASYNKKGECTVAFPGMSDTGVSIQMPEFFMSDFLKEAEKSSDGISKKDINALYKDLMKCIKQQYKEAEITVKNDSAKVKSAEFKGQVVTVEFDKSALADLCDAIAEVIEDSDLASEYDELESFAESISYLGKSCKEIKASLVIETYVKGNGEVVGWKFKFKAADNESANAEAAFLKYKNSFGAYMKSGGEEVGSISVDGKNSKSGTITVKFGEASFKADYENFGTTKLYGQTIPTGKFTLKLKIDDAMSDFLYYDADLSRDQIAMLDELGSVVIEIKAKGKGVSVTLSGEMKDVMRISSVTVIEDAGSSAKAKCKDTIDVEDEDELADLGEELSEHFSDLDDPIFSSLAN